MRVTASTFSDGARLEGDVVVVGAGPMGIVTALELADAGHRVVLIESGSLRYKPVAQDLSETDSIGDDGWHVAKRLAVRRQVGGTSSLWGGRCVPFDPIDFESRPALPDQLWPVSYDEMARYLPRACDWCVCGEAVFSATQVPELSVRQMIPGLPDGDIRTTDLERWALPTRFGKYYRRRLEQHPRLILVTDLTCVHVSCSPAGHEVDHLELRTSDGRSAQAVAQEYVLALGGLETTRLLMASDDVHTDGIGNHSGHLGRWYMAHVEARVADLHLHTPPDTTIYDHEQDADGVYVRRRFTLDHNAQKTTELSNAAVWLVNPEMGDPSHGSGILSGVYLTLISPVGRFLLAEAIRQAGTKTSGPQPLRAHFFNIVRDLWPATKFAISFIWRRFLRRGRKAPGFFVSSATNVYPLHYHGEHLPHQESHVELSDERDALGLRRLRTRLHFSEHDVRNVAIVLHRIDAHLRVHGIGYVKFLTTDVDDAVWRNLAGRAGYHQTGTTRMSALASDGVVGPDLAVHCVPNLSLASMSVFPTSSQANPTLTGVAFAVRLAERLDADLKSRASGSEDSYQAFRAT